MLSFPMGGLVRRYCRDSSGNSRPTGIQEYLLLQDPEIGGIRHRKLRHAFIRYGEVYIINGTQVMNSRHQGILIF
ncbi:MAG: hypothetical protein WCR04_09100 [Fibrobacteraceae bacterium]